MPTISELNSFRSFWDQNNCPQTEPRASWRNIAITLIVREKGERKARACEMACFATLGDTGSGCAVRELHLRRQLKLSHIGGVVDGSSDQGTILKTTPLS